MTKKVLMKKAAIFPALVTAGLLMTVAAQDGFAGFEWKAPSKTPVITTQDVLSNTGAAAPAASAPAGPALTGFGNDLPLVVALQQVVPAGYQFSFLPGVDPGATVSWQGGKPWQQSLGDMLATRKLGYTLNKNVISIAPAAAPAPVKTAAPAPVAPKSGARKSDLAFDDTIVGQDESPIVRRTGRRGSMASRRDVNADHRDWFDRMGDFFRGKKKETAAAAAPQPSSVQWDEKPATAAAGAVVTATEAPAVAAEKVTDVEAAPLPAPVVLSGATSRASGPISLSARPAQTAAAAPASAPTSDIVSGFGNDLPLSIAVEQVLPAGYYPDFDFDVDQTQFVSWKGGKPWKDVLGAMLVNKQLAFSVNGQNVRISSAIPTAEPVSLSAAPTKTKTIMVAPAPAPAPAWAATRDMTLKEVLRKWADKAGVDLYWSIDYDYRLTKDVSYGGTFEEAVRGLLNTMKKARPQPYGELHRGQDGRNVLIINVYALDK